MRRFCGVPRLERRFTKARLNALRMQLDPHFLFNAHEHLGQSIADARSNGIVLPWSK
jgi:LytS/YehU family sensor histidine kinase